MRRCFPQLAVLLTLAAGTVGNARLSAAPPADRVLPKETIVYLSTASLDGLFSSLEQSHLGQLWNDPKMKPFTDHLRDHPVILWVQAEDHAGMNLGQLREVATGESAMATIRLVKGKYARIFLFDVCAVPLAYVYRNLRAATRSVCWPSG